MEKQKIYICVDAGGTSSKAAIFSEEGQILERGFGKSGSPAVSFNEWYLHIDDAIVQVINNFSEKNDFNNFIIEKIALGVSGISALSSIKEQIEYFQNKYNTKCSITSDTITALYSVISNKDENGIVVISGTGIGILGKNKEETLLVGGWGHLIREYGSAYSIVHDFVVDIIDKYEAMIELDELELAFLKRYNIEKIRDFNHMFYQNSKDEIASYSVFFKEYAMLKNEHAIELLKKEGMRLAIQVENLMKHLKLENGTKIGLKGGFIERDGELIVSGFKEYMLSKNIILNYIKNNNEQLDGVYRYAIWHN